MSTVVLGTFPAIEHDALFRADIPPDLREEVAEEFRSDLRKLERLAFDIKSFEFTQYDQSVTSNVTEHIGGHVYTFGGRWGVPAFDCGTAFIEGVIPACREALERNWAMAMERGKLWSIPEGGIESSRIQYEATLRFLSKLEVIPPDLGVVELIRLNPTPELLEYKDSAFSFFRAYLPFSEDGAPRQAVYERRARFLVSIVADLMENDPPETERAALLNCLPNFPNDPRFADLNSVCAALRAGGS